MGRGNGFPCFENSGWAEGGLRLSRKRGKRAGENGVTEKDVTGEK